MGSEENGVVSKKGVALTSANRAVKLREMAETIKLEAETFGLFETEIRHLKRAYWYAEIENGLVPDAFKGDIRAIFVMDQLAEQMKCSLIEVLQGGYFVHGRFGWYAEFLIKRALVLGAYTRFDYEKAGSVKDGNFTIRAFGVIEDGTKIYGTPVNLAMAQAEGWTRNPKYKSMPELMLKKRAASFLIRETVPYITGGYHTAEELEDVRSQAERGTVIDSNPLDAMAALLGDNSGSDSADPASPA